MIQRVRDKGSDTEVDRRRQTDKQREGGGRDRERDRQKDRDRQMGRQARRQTDRKTERMKRTHQQKINTEKKTHAQYIKSIT